MDISPKIGQLVQLSGSLDACLNQIHSIVQQSQQYNWQNNALVFLQQTNPQLYQQHQALHNQIQSLNQFFQQQQQQQHSSIETLKGVRLTWENIKKDLNLNVLPAYANDSRTIIELVIYNIDASCSSLATIPITLITTASITNASENLKLLGHLLQNPPKLVNQPDPTALIAAHPTPQDVVEIFKKGEDDTKEQIGYYSKAGWAALVFGLIAVIGAVCVPFLWHIPLQLGALPFVSALIARLLAIGVLVYIASILLQRHRDMVHLAARAREFRAHVKMISAIPYFGGDQNKIEALTALLKGLLEKRPEAASEKENGFFLPAELLKGLGPLLQGLRDNK